MDTTKVIYTKNSGHLGDCIYTMIFLKNIDNYLKDNNIHIYFYCTDDHHYQVKEFNNSSNIFVYSCSQMINGIFMYNLWIGSIYNDFNWYTYISGDTTCYDHFFCQYYSNFLNILDIPIKIEKFIYEDDDLMRRCIQINKCTNDKYKNIDFLINNAEPMSGQVDYNLEEWNNFLIKLSEIYNIVTTQKVANIKCTRDDNLTAKDIAAIGLNIKNFIMIESGVVAGFYNKYITENSNITFYKLSKYDYHQCSFSNFIHIPHISHLYFLLEKNKELTTEIQQNTSIQDMKWYENIPASNIYTKIDDLLNDNINLFYEEAIVFLVNTNTGFGSQLTLLIQNALYLKTINNNLHCLGHFSQNGENFKYHDDSVNNSFFLYFKYLKPIPENTKYYFVSVDLICDKYPFVYPHLFDVVNVDDIAINRHYSYFFKKNYAVKLENFTSTIERVNEIKRISNKPLIGIHMRSIAQYYIEHPSRDMTVEMRFSKIKEILDNKYVDYNVFISTDVENYITKCKDIFINSSVFYNNCISRIDDHGDGITGELYGYKDSVIYLNKFTGYKLGADIIKDCLSLINCDYYYTSITNVTFITSFLNNKNNGVHFD
jgi:hypothetical protein